MPLDEAVFADTGGEVPETYEYLKVAREYLAARWRPPEGGAQEAGRIPV